MTTIFKINTTAYTEEDFMLLTNLTEKQIVRTIKPVIDAERIEGTEYNNADLLKKLKQTFPNHVVEMYTEDTIEEISI